MGRGPGGHRKDVGRTRIELQGPLHFNGSLREIAPPNQLGTESDVPLGIVGIDLDRLPGQPFKLVSCPANIAVRTQSVVQRRPSLLHISEGELGVFGDRRVKELDSFGGTLLASFIEIRETECEQIIALEIGRPFASRRHRREVGQQTSAPERGDHAVGDFVLHREDIAAGAIPSVRPKARAGAAILEQRADAKLIAFPLDRTRQDITNVQVPCDAQAHVRASASVSLGRGTADTTSRVWMREKSTETSLAMPLWARRGSVRCIASRDFRTA